MANGSQQKFSKKMQSYKQIVAQVCFRLFHLLAGVLSHRKNIPSLFNYGHVHYYALESVEDINGAEEIEDGLGQI